jgi:hypothetical protein
MNERRKKTMVKTVIYKTLHRKIQIEQHEPHKTLWGKLVAPEV